MAEISNNNDTKWAPAGTSQSVGFDFEYEIEYGSGRGPPVLDIGEGGEM